MYYFQINENNEIYSTDLDDDLIKTLEDFFSNSVKTGSRSEAIPSVKCFLSAEKIKRLSDINDQSVICFLTSDKVKKRHKIYVKQLIAFLIGKQCTEINAFTQSIISYNNLTRYLCDGYNVINENDGVPEADKVIFEYKNKCLALDFSKVEGAFKKQYLKNYFFSGYGPDLKTKASKFNDFVSFLKYVPDEKKLNIIYKCVSDYKSELKSSDRKDSSIFVSSSTVKNLCEYLRDENLAKIDNVTLSRFASSNVNSKGFTKFYTEDEINAILAECDRKISLSDNEISLKFFLIKAVILMVLNSAMRAESIVNLKKEELIADGKYYYYETESRSYKKTKYNLTDKMVQLHFEVLAATSHLRSLDSAVSDYLFIYKKKRGKTICKLSGKDITNEIKRMPKTLNISDLGIAGIRNRFMNKITSGLDAATDKALLQGLSAHSLHVHYRNYYDSDLDKLAVDLYGVTIGEVELKCIIKKDEPINKEKRSIVMNGLGSCSKAHCSDTTDMECYLCKHFVTTPANIPYFINEIKRYDDLIYREDVIHEKEFLVAKKRVLVKIMMELMRIKGEVQA